MYFVAFDIGGTSVKHALLNDKGQIIEKGNYATPKTNKEDFYKEILEITRSYCLIHEINGVCLSLPGVIDAKKGIVKLIYSIPALQGVNIKNELEELLEVDVSIENDSKCAALAEVWQGNAKDYKDSLFVVIGNRIGGAIVKNKKIHHGSNLYSGEFGMMLLNSQNGKIESWSYLASTINLVKRCEKILGENHSDLKGEDIFDLAEQGNELIKEEVDKFYNNLAIGIYNLQFIYDPEVIIIGGGISKREDLIVNINAALNILYKKTCAGKNLIQLKSCKFTGDANLIGALYNFLYA